jgi:hypothetical protein
VITKIDTHAIMEVTISVQSMPRLYSKDQPPLQESLEPAVGRVGGWCEMAVSLRGCGPGSREMSTVGRCYQAVQCKTVTENISLCVIVICNM